MVIDYMLVIWTKVRIEGDLIVVLKQRFYTLDLHLNFLLDNFSLFNVTGLNN